MYKIEINFGGILGKKIYRFPTLDKAQNFADKYFERTGDIVAISSVRNDIFFLCPIGFLTTRRLHDCLRDIKIKIFLPVGRIKFKSGIGANEKSPAFGSVVLKLQDEYELETIRI